MVRFMSIAAPIQKNHSWLKLARTSSFTWTIPTQAEKWFSVKISPETKSTCSTNYRSLRSQKQRNRLRSTHLLNPLTLSWKTGVLRLAWPWKPLCERQSKASLFWRSSSSTQTAHRLKLLSSGVPLTSSTKSSLKGGSTGFQMDSAKLAIKDFLI